MTDELGSGSGSGSAAVAVDGKRSRWLNAYALAGAALLELAKKQQSAQVPVDIDPLAKSRSELSVAGDSLQTTPMGIRTGSLHRVTGLIYEVRGLPQPIGSLARVESSTGQLMDIESVGFRGDVTLYMGVDQPRPLAPGAAVYPLRTPRRSAGAHRSVVEQTSPGVDERLLGRVVDGLGRPLDGRPPITSSGGDSQRIEINPLTRKLISEPLETGVRAVDSLLTIGRGQRVGIFAGSGVGKSVLLGMLAGRVAADVVVVGLIGERGREVREFCDDILGPKGLQRSVVVAAPADAAPLARLRGAFYATRVAQYFRDTGRHTVLILDSLSRFGMAQREIALSTGEPPATKGYPPSVFAKIPELVEMAGNSSNEEGSLTSFYTVLLEGDDTNDPVADTARAILDGHIFLSRDLSEMGHYPAIDVERSISRAMPRVVTAQQLTRAGSFKQMWTKLSRSQDLVSMGAYAQGSDPILDRALAKRDAINAFLRQGMTESTPFAETLERLAQFA